MQCSETLTQYSWIYTQYLPQLPIASFRGTLTVATMYIQINSAVKVLLKKWIFFSISNVILVLRMRLHVHS